MTQALLNLPARVRRGDIFEIRALVAHPMETGLRTGPNGGIVPRNIIEQFRGLQPLDPALGESQVNRAASGHFRTAHVRSFLKHRNRVSGSTKHDSKHGAYQAATNNRDAFTRHVYGLPKISTRRFTKNSISWNWL